MENLAPSELAARIRALHHGTGTFLVAIDGLGGSGKSRLAARLAADIRARDQGSVSIVHGDDFFLPSAQRAAGAIDEKPIGGDVDWRRLREHVLDPLRRNQHARYQPYDWDRDALVEWRTVPPGAVVVIEGVYTLRPELRDAYDFRIWIDCPRHVRLARGIARDGEGARSRWEDDWMPSEDRYVAQCRPMKSADVVVSGR